MGNEANRPATGGPPPLPEIDPPGVSAMGLTNCAGKPFLGFRHHNEMHMVRHQAPGPDCHAAFAAPFSHQRYIGMIVIVAEKGLLAAIAALRDMMGKAWGYNAGDTCHKWRVSEICDRVN